MRMDDNADAKRILLAYPLADWRRQPGRPRITWLSIVQQDLKQHHLTLPEAADLAQNRPLWAMMSTYGAQSWVACQKWRRRRSIKTSFQNLHEVLVKVKVKVTCYSTAYMSQTRDQQCFTMSEVAADWHEPMILQQIMQLSAAWTNGQHEAVNKLPPTTVLETTGMSTCCIRWQCVQRQPSPGGTTHQHCQWPVHQAWLLPQWFLHNLAALHAHK